MKINKLFFFLFVFFSFSTLGIAQRHILGKVTQVIDGRTVVVESPTAQRYTIQMQYVEVPDAAQPLSAVVKDHLTKFLLDKNVKVLLRQMSGNVMVGKVYLGEIDMSGQMLRDGAVWYIAPEKDSHDALDSESYLALENAAKAEKRGVWSVEGLKPAWEFRAEQEKLRKEAEKAEEAERLKREQEKPKNASTGIGLNQFDINAVQLKSATQASKPAKQSIKSEEWEIVAAPSKTIDVKQQQILEAVEEMRDLLAGLLGTDSLSSFQVKLGRVRVSVAIASEKSEKGRIRILMQENVVLLKDLNHIMTWFIENDVTTMFYKGDAMKIADKYGVASIRSAKGDFVLRRDDIFKAIVNKAMDNFLEIKTIVDKENSK